MGDLENLEIRFTNTDLVSVTSVNNKISNHFTNLYCYDGYTPEIKVFVDTTVTSINHFKKFNGLSDDGRTITINSNDIRPILVEVNLSYTTNSSNVTTIGDNCFEDCTSLKHINIPITIQTIGDNSFFGCGELFSITGDSVDTWAPTSSPTSSLTIGENAFKSCAELRNTLNFQNISTSLTINSNAFMTCNNITTLYINAGSVSNPNGSPTIFNSYSSDVLIVYVESSTPIPLDYFMQESGQSKLDLRYTIPSGTTSINDNAFKDYERLTTITISDDVESIGMWAFQGCTDLISCTLPNNTNFTVLSDRIFDGCTSLISIVIPSSVVQLGSNTTNGIDAYCFYGCTNLVSCTFQNNSNLRFVYRSIFENCTSLKSFNFPTKANNNDKNIQLWGAVFKGSGLETFLFNDSVSSIGWSVFANCTSLQIVTFAENSQLNKLNGSVFSGCTALRTIDLTSIEEFSSTNIFQGCINLISITHNLTAIPDNYNDIINNPGTWTFSNQIISRNNIFMNCVNLNTKFHISSGGPTFGNNVFQNCHKLTEFRCVNPGFNSGTEHKIFEGYDGDGLNIHIENDSFIQDNKFATTTAALEKMNFHYTISDGTTAIGDNAFENNLYLTSLVLPVGVTSIGASAFKGSSLESIILPNSITSIGNNAFEGCSNLINVTIHRYTGDNTSTPITLGTDVFKDIHASSEITIYSNNYWNETKINDKFAQFNYIIIDGTTSIPNNAFQNKTNLKSIVLPNTITSIGDNAFNGCSNLINITIHPYPGDNTYNTPITIGTNVFTGINASCEITIYSQKYWDEDKINVSVTFAQYHYILDNPNGSRGGFNNKSNINSLFITNNYTVTLPEFKSCTNLSSVTFEENSQVEQISEFSFCTSLTNIVFPNSVETIVSNCFQNCTSLVSCILPSNTNFTYVPGHCFKNCTALASITIPDNVTTIGSWCFLDCSNLTSVTFEANSLLTHIYQDAFYNSGLTSIEIPRSVTLISSYVFQNCSDLTNVTIHRYTNDNTSTPITFYGDNTFLNINASSEITIYSNGYWDESTINDNFAQLNYIIIDGTTSIPNNAFQNKTKLKSIVLPDGVETIGDNAFEGCTNLIDVTIHRYPNDDVNNSEITLGITPFNNINASSEVTIYSHTNWDDINNMFDKLHYIIIDGTTSIPNNAFQQTSNLISVVLPDGVTSIGDDAFWYCGNLESIHIPESVTSIGNNAFQTCFDLKQISSPTIDTYTENEIKIPDHITFIGDGAFRQAGRSAGVTKFILPNNLTTIGVKCFEECRSLVSIEIPRSVTSIGNYAFNDCESLVSIEIPRGVTSIGNYAFWYCVDLESIHISESVTSIGNYAFNNCEKLHTVTFEANSLLETIGDNAFARSGKLTSFPFEDLSLLTTIGNDAFNCSSSSNNGLTGTITIPNRVTTIGDNCFYDCSINVVTFEDDSSLKTIGENAFAHINLESLDIPDTVTFIGYGAFRDCHKLDNVTIHEYPNDDINNSPIELGAFAFLYVKYTSEITIYSKNQWNTSSFFGSNRFSKVNYIIIDGTTSIPNNDFEDDTYLKSIILPNTVETIGDNAFNGCSSLINVTIHRYTDDDVNNSEITLGTTPFDNINTTSTIDIYSNTKWDESKINNNFSICHYYIIDGTTSIADNAFLNFSDIEKITIPNTVTSIGNSAFNNCTNLGTVTFETVSSLVSIGNSAFENTVLTGTITIPDTVETIGTSAFKDCGSLKGCNLPSNNSNFITISDNTFENCSVLTGITIPNTVTSIGTSVFKNCGSLGTVTFETVSSLVSIGNSAFENTVLTGTITIPDTVETIGTSAFKDCGSLASCNLPSNTEFTSVPNDCFNECTALTSITIPNTVTSIGNSAFKTCTSLGTVTFETVSSLISIGNSAFENTGLTGITIPDTVTSIGTSVFKNCGSLGTCTLPLNSSFTTIPDSTFESSSLTGITIHTTFTSIGNSAFKNSGLNSITIPDTVEIIGTSAFSGITGITEIDLPNSITDIRANAFKGCTNLIDVTIHRYVNDSISPLSSNQNQISLGIDVFLDVGEIANSEITIYSHNEYWNEPKINNIFDELHYILFTNSTVNSLTSIASNEFEDVGKLKTIVLANTINSIGVAAFRNSGLTSIEIPSGVTIIQDNTFDGCTDLTSVTFKEISSLTTINPFAFHNSGLTSITIPDTITSILGRAFENTKLTSITIPNTIPELQDKTFHNCTELTQVTFEENSSLTTIGEDVFRNTDLTSITIPNSVTSIGDRAFQGLSNLESFTLPSNSEFDSIPNSLFLDSIGNLTGGSIPLSVTNIGSHAFTSTDAPAVGVMLRVPRFVLDWNTIEQRHRFHSNFILHYNHFDNYFYENRDISFAHYEPDTNSDKHLEFTEYKNRGNNLKYFRKGIVNESFYNNYTNHDNTFTSYPSSTYNISYHVIGDIGYKINGIDIGRSIAPYYNVYTNVSTTYTNVKLIPGWTKVGILAIGGGGGGQSGYAKSGGGDYGGGGGGAGGMAFRYFTQNQLNSSIINPIEELEFIIGSGGNGGAKRQSNGGGIKGTDGGDTEVKYKYSGNSTTILKAKGGEGGQNSYGSLGGWGEVFNYTNGYDGTWFDNKAATGNGGAARTQNGPNSSYNGGIGGTTEDGDFLFNFQHLIEHSDGTKKYTGSGGNGGRGDYPWDYGDSGSPGYSGSVVIIQYFL